MSGRLPRGVSGTDAVRALERAGWEVVRTRGSHCVMRYLGLGRRVVIPLHRELKPGTLNRILKQAVIDREEFVRLLRGKSSGAASVEYVALAALLALLIVAAIAALVADPPTQASRELGSAIGRKIACAPRIPDPCNRNPLARAYGFPLGKLVRYLAPAVAPAGAARGSGLIPVDFRYCRRASCAVPGAAGLTTARRRATAFTQLDDRRRSGGGVTVSYWLYRPTIGWERVVRTAGAAEIEAAQSLRLRVSDDPALVPLETLPGRNHYEFTRHEEPPWRWRVAGRYPG